MQIPFPQRDYSGYIFDLDGTLIDSMPAHFEAWREGLRVAGFVHEFDEEYFYSLGGVPTAKIVELLNTRYGLALDPAAVTHAKEEIYLQMLPRVARIEPVVEFARACVARGRPVAIASGGLRPVVEAALVAAGLRDLFGIIATPEDVAHGKPAPDMFLLAAQRMGVPAQDCLVFEDAEMGRRAAVAAGMDYVIVPSAREGFRPDRLPVPIMPQPNPTFADLARREVLTQPIYEPGKPIEDVARELGLDPKTIIKLASNENPLGASPLATAAAAQALAHVQLYPDGGAVRLRARLARHLELAPEQVLVGNGSNELIELLGHVFLGPGDEAVMGERAFAIYKLITLMFGARPVEIPLLAHRHDLAAMRAAVTPRTKLVFLPSPNNPTGTANAPREVAAFAESLPPHVVLVFDEAYAEYLAEPTDLRPLIARGHKVICLRTFSKIYGLAGLRLGYGYAPRELVALLNRVRQPFNVNALALAAGEAALNDVAWVRRSRETNDAGLIQLARGVEALGLEYIPSVANFLTMRVGDGAGVFAALQRAGVIVRPMGGYAMPEWIRLSVGTAEQNDRALRELRAALRGASTPR